jgi:hypothetical protein
LAAGALGSSVVTASLLPATRRKGEYMNRGLFINPDGDPRWTAHIIRTQRSFSEVDRLSIALLEIRPTSFEGMSRHAADVLDELIIKA